jgi:hypothetical protein
MTGNIEELRRLRDWHYRKAQLFAESALKIEISLGRREYAGENRRTQGTTAQNFRSQSSEHLRFVKILNGFFPENDRIV